MDNTIQSWAEEFVGAGPIVIVLESMESMNSALAPTAGDAALFLVAGAAQGAVVRFPIQQLPRFLLCHQSENFVSPDGEAIAAAMAAFPNPRQSEAAVVWGCLGASRWINLGLLDLLVRIASGVSVCRTRPEAEFTAISSEKRSRSTETRPENDPPRDKNPPVRDRIDSLLRVFEDLNREFRRLQCETTSPRTPEYRQTPLAPAELEALVQKHTDLLRHCTEQLAQRVAERPRGSPPLERQGPKSSSRAPATRMPPPHTEPTVAGRGSLFRGQIALQALAAQSDLFAGRVQKAWLADLRDAAEARYEQASRELHQSLGVEARPAFRWMGRQVGRQRGYIDVTSSLAGWLRKTANSLVDRLNQRAPVPRDSAGEPTRNPEHWGTWIACDRALWAWREVTRLAEVLRFTTASDLCPPRFEIVPRLRSLEPNLEVYRQLQVPVLGARPRHVLLAGRISDLALRCFAVLGRKRGYFPWQTSRLGGYLLGLDDPVGEIATELAQADDAPRQEQEEEAREAEPGCVWRRQTEGLLHAAILGIPDSFLKVFLECQYQVETTTLEAIRLKNLLASDVVSELESCLEDRTTDIVWARLGRSSQDELEHRAASAFPTTVAARLRNNLKRTGSGGLQLSPDRHPAPEEIGRETATGRGQSRADRVRGSSLGGRLTARGTHPVVLQHEVLATIDEVMLEVAYEVLAGGHRLLGIAGEEFVVEVPESRVPEAERELAELARRGASRLLGQKTGQVVVAACDRW